MEPGEEHVPGGFQGKPWWARMLVYFSGPAASFVLAYLVFCALGLTVGLPITGDVMNRVDLVMPNSEAERVGLASGDVILAMNGKQLKSGNEMLGIVHGSSFKQLEIRVRRDGRVFTVKATPRPQELEFSKLGLIVAMPWDGKVPNRIIRVKPGTAAAKAGFKENDVIRTIDGEGITSSEQLIRIADEDANKRLAIILQRDKESVQVVVALKPDEIQKDKIIGLLGFVPVQRLQRVGLVRSVHYGNEATSVFVTTTVRVIFSREVKEAVGGPLAIADATLNSVKRGPYGYLQLMGILSLSLAIVNILPIPVVDGGQMMMLAIEAIRRRRLSAQTWELSQRIGWTMIAIIFALIMYLDLSRLAANKLFR
jgi:regulator of sigma E protease